MRALVISDTHLGAWTGEDLLSQDRFLSRLEPELEGIDELVVLGDLFDLLFGSIEEALAAAEGLFALIRERLQGKRLVFLAGNHDHHFVVRAAEDARLLGSGDGRGGAGDDLLRRLLAGRLEGIEIDVRYPTYAVGDVLLTHGHYLDPHARLAGPLGSRLLTRALWAIAAGGKEEPRTEADYDAIVGLLTELLYAIAQVPHGTTAQRSVFDTLNRVGGWAKGAARPARAAEQLALRLAGRAGRAASQVAHAAVSHDDFRKAIADERERVRRDSRAARIQGFDVARTISPGDPREKALEAFAKVVDNLGWSQHYQKIVFAHTHQPFADRRASPDSPVRYWNTGCWIYEPELSSREAYISYLERAWPGTAIVVDTDEAEPQLLELLADLNPLRGGEVSGSPAARI
jgi:UDP-2,3-diacylglucosamine pyrophosphatase LpxH